nr:MAG TPA: hypothetical protein [Caudoviricetes sp.]
MEYHFKGDTSFTKNFQKKSSKWVAKLPLIEYNKSEEKG